MKSSIFIILFLLLFSVEIKVNNYNDIQTIAIAGAQTPCVNCDNKTEDECQRVNTPSGPHIFYGNRSTCGDEFPPGG